jgi:hypothetical protein
MSQIGHIDAVTESAHIPKGQLKNTQPPATATAILHTDKEGLARHESSNYPSVIGQHNYLANNLSQIYHSQFTNAHDSLRNLKLYMKRQ